MKATVNIHVEGRFQFEIEVSEDTEKAAEEALEKAKKELLDSNVLGTLFYSEKDDNLPLEVITTTDQMVYIQRTPTADNPDEDSEYEFGHDIWG